MYIVLLFFFFFLSSVDAQWLISLRVYVWCWDFGLETSLVMEVSELVT